MDVQLELYIDEHTDRTTGMTAQASTYPASPSTSLASPSTSLDSPSTSLASPSTSLASPSTSLASPSTSLASPSTSLASPSTSLASPSTSLASHTISPSYASMLPSSEEQPVSRHSQFINSLREKFFADVYDEADADKPSVHHRLKRSMTERAPRKPVRDYSLDSGLSSPGSSPSQEEMYFSHGKMTRHMSIDGMQTNRHKIYRSVCNLQQEAQQVQHLVEDLTSTQTMKRRRKLSAGLSIYARKLRAEHALKAYTPIAPGESEWGQRFDDIIAKLKGCEASADEAHICEEQQCHSMCVMKESAIETADTGRVQDLSKHQQYYKSAPMLSQMSNLLGTRLKTCYHDKTQDTDSLNNIPGYKNQEVVQHSVGGMIEATLETKVLSQHECNNMLTTSPGRNPGPAVTSQEHNIEPTVTSQEHNIEPTVTSQEYNIEPTVTSQEHNIEPTVTSQEHNIEPTVTSQEYNIMQCVTSQEYNIEPTVTSQEHNTLPSIDIQGQNDKIDNPLQEKIIESEEVKEGSVVQQQFDEEGGVVQQQFDEEGGVVQQQFDEEGGVVQQQLNCMNQQEQSGKQETLKTNQTSQQTNEGKSQSDKLDIKSLLRSISFHRSDLSAHSPSQLRRTDSNNEVWIERPNAGQNEHQSNVSLSSNSARKSSRWKTLSRMFSFRRESSVRAGS